MNKKVASWIAGAVQARNECARKVKTGEDNLEWYDRWEDRVERVVGELFPSGSGFDAGTKFDWEKSTSEKLVFHFGYHHLNENGFYTHWSEHKVTVKASLANGFDVKITKDRVDDSALEYYYDVVNEVLGRDIDPVGFFDVPKGVTKWGAVW